MISVPQAEMVRTIFERYSQGGVAVQHRHRAQQCRDAQSRGSAMDRKADRADSRQPSLCGAVRPGRRARGWATGSRSSTSRRGNKLGRYGRATRGERACCGPPRASPYLLSGMLFCGHCDRKLVHRATHNGQREGIYVCIEPGGSCVRAAPSPPLGPTSSSLSASWVGAAS